MKNPPSLYTLVLNAGSSSLRFSLFNEKLEEIYKGHIDGIGQKTCSYKSSYKKKTFEEKVLIKTHAQAIELALKNLLKEAVIENFKEIKKVAHRVVHGGEKYTKPTALTSTVIKQLEALSDLAPLHNPVNLLTIKACKKALPSALHFALFDTAFHHTLPPRAFLYGLPYSLYKKDHYRRFGFHGSSYQHLTKSAQDLLKKKKSKLIICHIGNGISLSAIENGQSLDTSMGYTPMEGPMMGTRCGSIDPGLVLKLVEKKGLEKTKDLLQKESGIKGLSELGSDIRTLWAKPKDPGTIRSFDVLSYQIAKLILSFFAPLKGFPDAIIFSAGIGENAYYLRAQILSYLEPFGVRLDKRANLKNALCISSKVSKIKILVLPTNEALEMARQI